MTGRELLERLTHHAKQAFTLARDEARKAHFATVHTEHLLLAYCARTMVWPPRFWPPSWSKSTRSARLSGRGPNALRMAQCSFRHPGLRG